MRRERTATKDGDPLLAARPAKLSLEGGCFKEREMRIEEAMAKLEEGWTSPLFLRWEGSQKELGEEPASTLTLSHRHPHPQPPH